MPRRTRENAHKRWNRGRGRMRPPTAYHTCRACPYQSKAPATDFPGRAKCGILDPGRVVGRFDRLNGLTVQILAKTRHDLVLVGT